MKLVLFIKEEAKLEIINAYQYYENARPGLGEIFLKYLDDCFERVISNPLHFPIKRSPFREAIMSKFPYLIVFELTKESILVYSVFNTWRNPEKKPNINY